MKNVNIEFLSRPPHLDRSFLLPDTPVTIPIYSITDKHKVLIAGSLDTGWFTKGSCRTYDRLAGTTRMGELTKKVLSTISPTRVCRKCKMGFRKGSHDCILNFYGTAEAMDFEP